MEVESNGVLPFLGTLMNHDSDGSLGHFVYREPTRSGRYLDVLSHHHRAQKDIYIIYIIYPFSPKGYCHIRELFHVTETLTKKFSSHHSRCAIDRDLCSRLYFK